MHCAGAGELAACAGADLDGAVASREPAVSGGDAAGDQAVRDGGRAGAGGGVHAAGAGGGAPVSGGDGLDDEPWEGWQFIQIGRYIERASATAVLLEAYHEELWREPERIADGNEYLEWMGLLRSATAFEAYCKVYTADLTPERILEFLLLDEEFPHSVRFSIDSLQRALEAIDKESAISRAEPLRRLAGKLQASLSYASVDDILNQDVCAYLDGIQEQCKTIHETIYELYVDYSIQTALAG